MDKNAPNSSASSVENKEKKPSGRLTPEYEDVYIPGFDDVSKANPVQNNAVPTRPDFFVVNANEKLIKPSTNLRTPPHLIEAEQNTLGGLMLYGQQGFEKAKQGLDLVKNRLHGPSDFYRRDHQFIYQAICDLAEREQPFDAVTVGDWILNNGKSKEEAAYVVGLATDTMSYANLKTYADIVRNKAAQRQLLQAARDIIDSVYERDGKEGIELLTDANTRIAQLCKENMRGGELKLMESGLNDLFQELEKRQNGTISGITPQWESVKKIIPKLEGGKLMILAARPAMGKSALALQWALHAAQNQQASAVFSLEMGMNELLMRTLSNLSNIPMHHLQQENGINDEQWARVIDAMRKMRTMPLAIDDSGSITVEQIRARAIHFHSQCQQGLKLIVVDYLQLMSTHGKKHANRNEEIAHISRELKQLARELNCPIIALSQLNRAVESRTDKTPNMADLRDSGAIEQDADLITFLYRPEYYAKNQMAVNDDEAGHAQDNINNACSLHIAKNRSGARGQAMLRAELQYCRFQDGTGLSLPVAEQHLSVNKAVTSWRKAA